MGKGCQGCNTPCKISSTTIGTHRPAAALASRCIRKHALNSASSFSNRAHRQRRRRRVGDGGISLHLIAARKQSQKRVFSESLRLKKR